MKGKTMNNYEKQFSIDIINAVQELKGAFDSQCAKENPYFEEYLDDCETRDGAIDSLSQDDNFIEEYLKSESVDLIKKILSKHVWFKYFSGWVPPALEDHQPTLERVAREQKEIKNYLKSIGEECNYMSGTPAILSKENASLKEKIRELEKENEKIREQCISYKSCLDTIHKLSRPNFDDE